MMNNSNVETSIEFNLTVNEANIVIAALRELPHRVVADLVTNIMNQVKEKIPNAYQAPNVIQ